MNWQTLLQAFQDCGGHAYAPVALQALSEFYRGLIPAGDLLRWVSLAHSSDLAAGECLLRSLPGISI